MIISVSRRTDIPAFYSEWFFERIKEGYVYVENPFNDKQVSRIELIPQSVDCFVFWTKNPGPMIDRLDELKDFKYYFQVTITGYKSNVERNIKDKRVIIENFKKLSRKIGKEKVILRYDPIFLSDEYTIEYHITMFSKLCTLLKGYTERCVISFIDVYKKIEHNISELKIKEMTTNDINKIAAEFSKIAAANKIKIETCSEEYDLEKYGIEHGKCIDDNIIRKIIGCDINISKDNTQRKICGCVKSIDIGAYNTCTHNCLHCYANFNHEFVKKNRKRHDIKSPLLVGKINEDTKITYKNIKSIKCYGEKGEQMSLL